MPHPASLQQRGGRPHDGVMEALERLRDPVRRSARAQRILPARYKPQIPEHARDP
ncbi:MAG: hypothetical protein HY775_07250 [Acidobacteria bacterium]|nr:hypothetical protein [Acidobacteriota bacterium]